MKRPIAAAALLVLGVTTGPAVARAPRPPAQAWDLFAADAWLGALADPLRDAAFDDPAPLDPARGPATVPEPTALVLTGAGLAAVAATRRRRATRQRPSGPARAAR